MMRSWLFVPGHRQRMIDKALGLEPDAVIFDLEDGVPPDAVDTARERVGAALDSVPGKAHRLVRTHAAGHAELDADLQEVIRPGLYGLALPKVERPDDVRLVDTALSEREPAAGLPQGSVRLLATIESALGLVQAPAIAAACPRLVGLMFGAEDFALDLGIFSTGKGAAGEMLYARSAVVVAAASVHLQAVDRVYLDIRDPDGLAGETRRARELGFTGKAVIHPGQIEVVHRVYRPTDEEVEQARRVVATFEAEGGGAIAADGRMVDLPVVKRARRILELHEGAS